MFAAKKSERPTPPNKHELVAILPWKSLIKDLQWNLASALEVLRRWFSDLFCVGSWCDQN